MIINAKGVPEQKSGWIRGSIVRGRECGYEESY
jgi:hypothetical protein